MNDEISKKFTTPSYRPKRSRLQNCSGCSSPASADSANPRISCSTVFPGVVGDGVGDINQDGCNDFLDISAFIAILASEDYDVQADLNFDGQVTFEDIPPFIAIFSSPING